MALHDVDKSSNNRLRPRPNAKDLNTHRQAHGTIGFTLKQEDSATTLGKLIIKDGRLLLQSGNNTFIDVSDGNLQVYDTDSTNNVIIGKKPDGAGGIAVSKPGTNVEDIY